MATTGQVIPDNELTPEQRDFRARNSPSGNANFQDVKTWNPVGDIRDGLGYGPGKQQTGAEGNTGRPMADAATVATFPIDPATGYRFDATTGRVYTADGQLITNPTVSQQVAANFGARNSLLGKLGQGDAEHAAALSGQNNLLTSLNNTTNNPNASSVAQTGLAINNDLNARQALGSAAGVGGANAFAARRQALQAIGTGNLGTAQTSALVRAKEVADANAQKGNILGQMSLGADRKYATDLGGAGNFGQLSSEGEAGLEGLNTKTDEASKQRKTDLFTDVLGGFRSASRPKA